MDEYAVGQKVALYRTVESEPSPPMLHHKTILIPHPSYPIYTLEIGNDGFLLV
jgi:hypothetical protein